MKYRTEAIIGLCIALFALIAAFVYQQNEGKVPSFSGLQMILNKYFSPGATTSSSASMASTASSTPTTASQQGDPSIAKVDLTETYNDFLSLLPASSPYTAALKECASKLDNAQKAIEFERALLTLTREFSKFPERQGLSREQIREAVNNGFSTLGKLGQTYIDLLAGMALLMIAAVAKADSKKGTDYVVYDPTSKMVRFVGKLLDGLVANVPRIVQEYKFEGVWKNKDYAAPMPLGEFAVILLMDQSDMQKREPDRLKTFDECPPCNVACHRQRVSNPKES